jgi:hypothetical protein
MSVVANERELSALPGTEEERVFTWRVEQLERAGYRGDGLFVLAAVRAVDLHLAESLLGRGCPQATALRILL